MKPDWKYEKKCCKECDKKYVTDNMISVKKGSYAFIWYCILCYNLQKQSQFVSRLWRVCGYGPRTRPFGCMLMIVRKMAYTVRSIVFGSIMR